MEIARAYTTLGLDGRANRNEARAAYRRQLLLHHPDGGGTSDPAALDEIRAAYRTVLAGIPAQLAEPYGNRRVDVYA